MSIKFKKTVRDLVSSPKKTLLVVFALSLGVLGVGSVVVSYTILTKDLNTNYQSTVPCNVIFHSSDFSNFNLAEFSKNKNVAAADLRDFALKRIEIRPNIWIPLWLYGVEDFNNMPLAKIFHQRGEPIPIAGSILMERDGLLVSDIKLGDSPRVRVGANTYNVNVSGICFDPAQAPATQDAIIYAYTDKQTWSAITDLPSNERLIVKLNDVHSKQDVEKQSNLLLSQFKKMGIEITSVEVPKFNEHPHQWQLNTLIFLIGTIGLLAFIMGAVLVSQLMRSILSSQIRQIGIMKSLGATTGQILRMYVLMLTIIGFVSGLIAIPLAAKAGMAFSKFVAFKLNFDILTTSVPFGIYIILFIASILLPILLSLPMLLKGTSTSVKNALINYGISTSVSKIKFNFIAKLRLNYIDQLAIKNSLRNTKRLVVTITAMAFGAAIFNTGFNVRQSLWVLLSDLKNELRYDVQVVLDNPISKKDALKWFNSVGNVKRVETWIGGRGEIQSKVVATDIGAGIIALPINTNYLKLKIADGRWLAPSSDFEVVFNQQAHLLYGNPALGSKVVITVGLNKINAKLVGIAEQFEKAKIYCNIQQYDSILNPNHLVNNIVFEARNKDFKSSIELKKNIETAIVPSDLKVLYVMSQAERVKIIYDHLDIVLSSIIILSFLVLVVSAVGMASATGINIWERTREIGVMKAIGATPKSIYRLFILEGLVSSILSILLGLIIAYPLSWLAAIFFGNLMLGEGSNLEYAFSTTGFLITILVTLLFGFLASRIPARSAIKLSTQKSLSYE